MSKYHKKFAFSVLIAGISYGEFRTCSGLEKEIEIMEEAEGGAMSNNKELGRVSYKNITLSRGMTDNEQAHKFYKGYEEGVVDVPVPVTIIQRNRGGDVLKTYAITAALPVRYKAGDWDAKSSEAIVEELEFAIDKFEIIKNK